jgi:two-component system sensor histidine kinase MprB
MTFRARIAMASAVAVAIAVLLAAGGAFFVARNALLRSTDDTLIQSARTSLSHPFLDTNDAGGTLAQIVAADGSILSQSPAGKLPVDDIVQKVAMQRLEQTFTNATIDGTPFRELIVPIQAGVRIGGGRGLPAIQQTSPAALQLFAPLGGVNHQLGELGLTLAFVAFGGIIIAALLGLIVARTALRPLNHVTVAVEELAETTDMSLRLEEGRPDELGRLRKAFNGLFSALERSDDQQRQLVLDASHELRTPLTSLRTNTEILRRVDELDLETREQVITDMLTQIGELTTLIGDLTELARGEHHVAPATRFRLDELVDELIAIDATHARTKGVEITADLDPCWVNARRERLSRAIGNLLDNAIKWSPEGTTIEVSVTSGTVTVRDHGPGIAEDDLPKIFDRFYRSPAARSLPGSGLGLAIVAQVATEEGGSVAAARAEGGGAVLRLDLPEVS